LTAAERRAQEVKARRPRREEPDRRELQSRNDRASAEREKWVPERWQEAEALREVAEEATVRGRGSSPEAGARRVRKVNDPSRLDPAWIESVQRESTSASSARFMERLAAATEALERDRYRDALRMVSPVLKNLPNVGGAHEVAGVAHYRLGEWRKAIAELEIARQLHPAPEQLPIIADCYRALRRYRDVDEVWRMIREASPSHEVMAEGRIVAAGALADQGDIAGALKLMFVAADAPKKVREHHLKQWYVIADLYDRSGDVVKARNFFRRISAVDPRYADVADRLVTLGRR
jgi:tetratricopeptide (TPR) repeat protein